MKNSQKILSMASLLSLASLAQAQVVEYHACSVDDYPAFHQALDDYYLSLNDGDRPIMVLDRTVSYGENPVTHFLFELHPDYASLGAYIDRRDNSGHLQYYLSANGETGTCQTDGVVIRRGSWGVQEDMKFSAVYEIQASDRQLYVQAFRSFADELAQDIQDPVSIALYENRSGISGITHFVIFEAPSFNELNSFIDSFSQSRDYAAFVDEVADIRDMGADYQRYHMDIWRA